MKHSKAAGLAGAVLFLCAAAPASAAVRCGDVLMESEVLKRDLKCAPAPGEAALTIGADDVSLDLGGHEVRGKGLGAGISVPGRIGTTITGGAVRRFAVPVIVSGSLQTSVSKLRVRAGDEYGVQVVDASQTTIRKSSIADSERNVGIEGVSHENIVSGNRIGGGDIGVLVRGASGNAVTGNSITGSNDAAVEVGGSIPGAETALEDNEIRRSEGAGILTRADAGTLDIGGNEILASDDYGIEVQGGFGVLDLHDNVVEDSGYAGILVQAMISDNSVHENVVRRSGHDGLFLHDPETLVSGNTAIANMRLGINSSSSNGSGNVARNNGNPAQCSPSSLCE
jgi:parallel beta-helix repeat protein